VAVPHRAIDRPLSGSPPGVWQNRPVEHLTGRRRQIVTAFVVTVLAVQVGFAINGYRDPHMFFAFQPFNESSTWRADIVRVTSSGERLPIDGGWAGYTWNELVDMPALQGPSHTRHASMGVGATIDFLDKALDWIATHTPDDRETRYLEATVTTYQNTRGPTITVLRSVERDVP
jgi:hypothetical protein